MPKTTQTATKGKKDTTLTPNGKVQPKGKIGANRGKNPVGRPPLVYNPEHAERLCAEIATSTRSLMTIVQEFQKEFEGFPCVFTIFNWLRTNEEFSKLYARSKDEQADILVEQTLDIADDDSLDIGFTEDGKPFVRGENIQRSRLRVDTRKWLASKLKPKKYGEKIEQTIHTDPIMLLVGQIGASSLPLKP